MTMSLVHHTESHSMFRFKTSVEKRRKEGRKETSIEVTVTAIRSAINFSRAIEKGVLTNSRASKSS